MVSMLLRPVLRRLRRAGLVVAAGVAAASLAGARTQDADHAAERARLLEGVEALERVGVPGEVAVTGPDAFAVALGAGERGLPIIAAFAGDARVVAFAHDGYLAFDADARPGAQRLARNGIDWCAPRPREAGRAIRAAVLGRERGGATALGELGYVVVDDLGEADVLVWRGGSDLSGEERAALEAHRARGGGLVCAVCPWGWAQTHPGAELRLDLEPNRVLAPLGLAFGGGTASPGSDGRFALRTGREDDASAWRALQALARGETPARVDAIEHALRAVPPPSDGAAEAIGAFGALLDETLGPALEPSAAPTPDRPLRAEDSAERLAVVRATLAWREAARALPDDATDMPVAPGADGFPGAVPSDAEDARARLTLLAQPAGWRTTGVYLPAGGVVHVRVLPRASGEETDVTGWRLRVGAHRDELWHKDAWRRWPQVTDEVALEPGLTRLASPFGGPVYLVAGPGAGPLSAAIEGGVRAPLFELSAPVGEAAWATRRDAPGPWAELVGRRLAMTVPSESVRAIDDPAALMRFWDAVVEAHFELGAEPLEDDARLERFVADVQISAGYMHAGYPIMTHLDVAEPGAIQLDLAKLRAEGSWGHFHELGHNRQKSAWTFQGTGEVTCNLFALHAADKLCGIEPWEHPWLAGQKDAAREYLAAPDFDGVWRKRPGVALVTYAELQREFGWAPFTAAFASYRDGPAPRDDADKIATWIRRISISSERDLRPFFRRWGWPIADEVASDEALDALEPFEGPSEADAW